MGNPTRFLKYVKATVALLLATLALYGGQFASAEAPLTPRELLTVIEADLQPNTIANPLAGPNLQVAHLAPFAASLNDTAVNISINATPVLTDVLYGDSTGYLPLTAGMTQVQIFPSGSATPAISVTVDLMMDTDYTAIAVGGANGWPLELKLLEDDNTAPTSGSAKVRIGHLAPFAALAADTLADVRLQDGTVVLNDVPYGAVAGYLELAAGTYDLKITSADGMTTLIDPMPATFNDGDILSVFAVGDGSNQPVGAFALPSGAPGGLLDLAAALQIAHLAPFAGTPGAEADISLNGQSILTDVPFAGSTGYLPVPAGWNQVQVFPAGSATPAISVTAYLTHAMDYTAIAVGGANGWPLELTLLEDDNTAPTSGSAKVRIGHLAPFAALAADTLADVRLQDGTVILDDVPYGAVAGYLELPAGAYDLKITTPDGATTLIDPIPVTFGDGDILSAFAVGDGGNQPFGIFALPSGAPGTLIPSAPRLQLAHLAPFAGTPGAEADISLNGQSILTGVPFAGSTGYLFVPAGENQVQVFPAGSATPAISVTVTLTEGMDFTAVAVGGANGWPLELKLLEDDNTTPTSGSAKVRIGHLAPFAALADDTLADVRLQDGTVILNDVPYGAVAGYLELAAGTYDLKITSADGMTTLIDPMPATFTDGDILSVFAVGDGSNQPVGAFALPSGAPGALLDLAAALQIAHLAPFAEDSTLLLGTSVTIALNGEDILTGVKFADSTGYLPVPAGMNLVQVFPTGSASPAISATVYLTHAMDFTAVAVGGANGWPLELKLLEDDNSMPTSGSARVRIGHLAPFAALAADTLADVRLQDGTVILNDVPYGAVAGYLELPAGTYDLKITSPDGMTILIDPLPVVLGDGDILSIFAVGDGANQDLGIFALPGGAPGSLVPLAKFHIFFPLIMKNFAQ